MKEISMATRAARKIETPAPANDVEAAAAVVADHIMPNGCQARYRATGRLTGGASRPKTSPH
jgi:hypothetical protein